MEKIPGYQTPDESSYSDDSLSSFDVSSDSETFNSAIEQYPRFRELYESLYRNTVNNSQRSCEHSPKSTQHTGECSKKLDSVMESQVEILQLLKLLKEIFSEKNEQNGNLVTMNNYWDTKWRQASAVCKNMLNTVMHIKDTNATTGNKLNEIHMKFEGFIQDDLPKLKQNSDECVAKNIVIEEILHKCYNAVLNLNEVLCSEKSSDAVKTEELARNLNDTNNRVRNVENLLMDIKKQLDNNSKLDNMEKALVTPSVQQHYLPNRSCPTLPYLHYSPKTAITPLNNSFHHVNSSHTTVDEKYGNISFTSNRANSFRRKHFPEELLKQNTPPICVKLEPVDKNSSNDSIGVSPYRSSVSKGVSFDILSGSESKMDESRMFHNEANKSPRTSTCSDSKAEPDQTVKKNNTHSNLLSDSKDSSSYATNTRTKPKTNNSKEYRKRPKGIYEKNSSKMVVPHSVVSTSKECLEQQNEDLRGKEQQSKKSKKNAPISTTALDVDKSDDDDCLFLEQVIKHPRFNYQQNIPIVQENDANTQGKPSVSDPKKRITKNNYKSEPQAFASVSSASSSKKPSVLQSGDKKRDLKKNILTTRSANHDHMVFTSNEQNVVMSEETAASMQEKLKECSPSVQSIYNEQLDISYGEAISPAVSSASGAQRPASQQNQHRKGKKRYSKENSLNTPPKSAISAKVSNPQLHFRSKIQISRKNVPYDSPSISPTSRDKRPCYFSTEDPPKRKRRGSVYDLLK